PVPSTCNYFITIHDRRSNYRPPVITPFFIFQSVADYLKAPYLFPVRGVERKQVALRISDINHIRRNGRRTAYNTFGFELPFYPAAVFFKAIHAAILAADKNLLVDDCW